jgi:hypothetical protein
MKKPIRKTVQSREEYYIQFTDEEMAELKMEPGQKYSWEVKDGGVQLTPYVKVEMDISQWDKETLVYLIEQSCQRDVSVNDVIVDTLERYLKSEQR